MLLSRTWGVVPKGYVSGVGTSASPGARHRSILVVYTILLLAISTACQCVDATQLCSNSLVSVGPWSKRDVSW